MSRIATGPRVVTLANPSAGVHVGQPTGATGQVTIQGGQAVYRSQSGSTLTTDDAASSFVSRILYPDLSLVGGDGSPVGSTGQLQTAQPHQGITMYAVQSNTGGIQNMATIGGQPTQIQIVSAPNTTINPGPATITLAPTSGGGYTPVNAAQTVQGQPIYLPTTPLPQVKQETIQLKQEYAGGSQTISTGQTRTDYYCQDCNMTFSNANDFLEHVQSGHNHHNAPAVSEQKMQVLQVSAPSQATHLQPQTVNLTLPPGQQLNTSGPPGNVIQIGKNVVLPCNYCPATFTRRQALVDHINSVHQPTTAHLGGSGAQHQVVVAAGGPGQPPTIIQQAMPNQVQFKQESQQQIHYQILPGTNQAVPVQVQVTPAAPTNTGVQIAPASTTGTVVPPSGTPVPFVGTGEGLFCPECKNPFANKYSLMKHLRSTRCRHENEMEINKIINDQLTCGKCFKQFGSIQALKKHLEAKKCQAVEVVNRNAMVGVDGTVQVNIAGSTTAPGVGGGSVSHVVGQHKPSMKGLVFDETIQLIPNATVTVYRCPDSMCSKPCVTLRAFKMHAKCVHKGIDLEPLIQEAKANFICKVRGCGKLFVEEQQLDVHFKHHENYTPRQGKHKCHLCSEAFYQKDMLKKHVLSFHDEVSTFRSRGGKKGAKGKNGIKGESGVQDASTGGGGGYRRYPSLSDIKLQYNPDLKLAPGTMMTIYKCPVDSCNKRSCTDMKSFKLHCLHIHQDKDILPMVEDVEAKFICQVEGCGKLYLERKQYEIHQRHHKSYVPSKGRYYKCGQCDSKFNTQGNLDVHVIQTHMSGTLDGNASAVPGKNELIFDNITLEPGTMMTVYHCPVVDCPKRNYLDAKSVRTHCRRFHSMIDFEGIPSQAEAQYICQVRGCRKLFMEQVQIEAHLKHHRNYVPTNGVFECTCCPESFTRKEQLDQHTLSTHTTEGVMRSAGIQPNAQPQAAQPGASTLPTQVHNIGGVASVAQSAAPVQNITIAGNSPQVILPQGVGTVQAIPISGTQQQPQQTTIAPQQTGIVHHGVHGSQLKTEVIRTSQISNIQQPIQVQTIQTPIANMTTSTTSGSSHSTTGGAKVVGYQCSICMRKFLHLGTHCNHVNNVHQAPGLAPIEVDMKPRYTCKHPRCNRHFMTKNMFKAHMDRHASGKNKRAMNCFKCGRNFSQFKSLYQHVVQTHADVTPEEIAELEANHAKCPVCQAVFRSMDIMRVHLRRHQDQKNIIPNVLPPSTSSNTNQGSVQSSSEPSSSTIQEQQPTTSGSIIVQQHQPTPAHVQQVVQQAMQQHEEQQQQDIQQQQQFVPATTVTKI